jgi:hypothetical protein
MLNKALNHLEWLSTLSVRKALLIFALESYLIVGLTGFVGYQFISWLF